MISEIKCFSLLAYYETVGFRTSEDCIALGRKCLVTRLLSIRSDEDGSETSQSRSWPRMSQARLVIMNEIGRSNRPPTACTRHQCHVGQQVAQRYDRSTSTGAGMAPYPLSRSSCSSLLTHGHVPMSATEYFPLPFPAR